VGMRTALLGAALLGVTGLWAAGCDADGEGSPTPSDTGDVDVASDVDVDVDTDVDTDVDIDVTVCPTGADVTVRDTGIGLWTGCPGTFAELLPRALIAGEWLGGGAQGECLATGRVVACPAGEVGVVSAEWTDDETVVVTFEAAVDGTVSGLELSGDGQVAGATGWLSSGFQSWSQAGIVALGPPVGEAALASALAARGDGEVIRSGHELSWFYTAVGGGEAALVAGALSADRFKPWVQVARLDGARLRLRLAAGGAGEAVALEAGARVSGPAWLVATGEAPEALLEAWAERLPRGRAAAAEAGWNSWYELWAGVDEAAVRENAALAAAALGPYVEGNHPLRIVVDDGWQVLWGEWTPNEKFPSRLDGLSTELREAGFEVGVWLAPFLVDADSALVQEHAEWLVPGLVYQHTFNGPMRVLDVTHPEAARHLSGVIERLVGWGYDFLKIDFLFVGTWEGERYEDVTGMEAFHRGMALIREAAGQEVTLLAVAAPPVAVFPYVEAWRVGWDIALETFGPSWPFVQSQARSLAVRWPLCRAVLCDADPVLLRGLPEHEVDVGSWVVALSGGGLFLSDDLRALAEERTGWGLDGRRAALATGGVAGRPEAMFPTEPPQRLSNAFFDQLGGDATHVVPLHWRAPDGRRVTLNFGDEAVTVDGEEVAPRSALAW
jgi:alpha-galactosidase